MTTRGKRRRRGVHTFHSAGFWRSSLCALRDGLSLRKGRGFFCSGWRIFFSSCRVWFFSFLGQIGGFLAQYKFGGQPSKTFKLHVLLGDRFHLQVRPDYSHGRSTKYAGDIDKPSFCGHLFFNRGDLWLYCSSSRGGFWPPLFCRCQRLAGTSRLLCLLRHDFF
jgi:hypothetical protein